MYFSPERRGVLCIFVDCRCPEEGVDFCLCMELHTLNDARWRDGWVVYIYTSDTRQRENFQECL